MKFKLCVFRSIISVVNLVLLFVPGFFTWKIWKPADYPVGSYELFGEYSVSFSDVTLGGDSLFTFIIMMAFMLASIAFSILWLVRRINVNKILLSVVSAMPAVIIFVFYYMLTESTGINYSYTAGILYYIVVILVLVHFVSTIIGELSKNEIGETLENNPKQKLGLEIDQLKQYKDLLDSGVITQEEFEAKKKQLLGL